VQGGYLPSVSGRAPHKRVEESFAPFPRLTFPTIICRHLGATIVFSLDLRSHSLCWLRPQGGDRLRAARLCAAFNVGRARGCAPFYPPVNTECCVLRAWNAIHKRHCADVRTSYCSRNRLRHGSCPGNQCLEDPLPMREESKLGTHDYNRVPSARKKLFSPFLSGTSPVTPCGFFAVSLTSLFDTPLWSIDTWEPVPKIKHNGTPSISTETLGVSCSNMIENEVVTAFSRALEWEELTSFAPFSRFPDSPFALYLPFLVRGAYPGVLSHRPPSLVSTPT
jgi:hypothetical protein